jgi:hypothetical protein
MMHLLGKPVDASDDTLCLNPFPKKKRQQVTWIKGGQNVGWGIYFKEETNDIFFISMKLVLTAGAMGLFFLVWTLKHHKKDGSLPWDAIERIAGLNILAVDWLEAWLLARYAKGVAKKKSK